MAFYNNVPLKNKNGDTYYPQSKTNSIYDDDTGERLDKILEKFFIIEDEGETTGTVELDADTLGGEDREYFEGLVQDVDDKVVSLNGKVSNQLFANFFQLLYSDFYDINVATGRYAIYSDTMLHPPHLGMISGVVEILNTSIHIWVEYRPWNSNTVYKCNYNQSTWSEWTKTLNHTDLINTDTVGSSDTVPSSAVTYQLGQRINAISTGVQILDANEAINAGNYWVGNTASNIPLPTYGTIEVSVGGNGMWINQIFHDVNTNSGIWYRKNVNFQGWSNWVAISISDCISEFPAGITLIEYASYQTSNKEIMILNNKPSDMPSEISTYQCHLEILVGIGLRKIIRLTTYYQDKHDVYQRAMYQSEWIGGWTKLASTPAT